MEESSGAETEYRSTRSMAQFSCDGKFLKRLRERNIPYFEKTITSNDMLTRAERLVMPQHFIQDHSDVFGTVITHKGPNRRSYTVKLTIRSRTRREFSRDTIYFGLGWPAFTRANNFEVGDRLTFCLVGMSTFCVLVGAKSHAKAMATSSDEEGAHPAESKKLRKEECEKTTSRTPGSLFPKVGFNSRSKGQDGINRQHEDLTHKGINSRERFEAKFVSSEGAVPQTTAANSARPLLSPSKEINLSPERLEAWQATNHYKSCTRFPFFVRTLRPINIVKRLEVPSQFVKEHGDKFQAVVILQSGRNSDHLWNVQVVVTSSWLHHRPENRVQFGRGWIAFARSNGYKEGDSVRFSLVAQSKFVVDVYWKTPQVDLNVQLFTPHTAIARTVDSHPQNGCSLNAGKLHLATT